jgi:uncharacterized protein YndB with AHSA1/START domain
MADSVTESIYIRASKARVFDAFVNHIDAWWPRKGKYNYSFAGEDTQPGQIQIEPRLGGRFYETFANGQVYQIGEVRTWQPPDRLQLTWQGPEYKAPTLIDVFFDQADAHTKVTLVHSGFEAAGLPEYAESYGVGWNEILGFFTNWVPAE